MRPMEMVFPIRGVNTSEPCSDRGYAAQAPPATGEGSPCVSDNYRLGTALEPTCAYAEGQVPFTKYFSL